METIIKSYSHVSNPSTSYAGVVTNNKCSLVIIKPKNPEQNISKTKADLFDKVNPVQADINVAKDKNVSEGAIVVSCSSNEDVKKFKSMAETNMSEKYVIKEVKGLYPRIRVSGFRNKYEPDVLENIIHVQNKCIVGEHSEIKCISINQVKNETNVYYSVVQVDHELYSRVIKGGSFANRVQFLYCL